MGSIKVLVRIFMSLLGLAFDEANRLYWKLTWLLTIIVSMAPLGLALNVFGYAQVNIVISLILACATMIFWWHPERIAAVALAGAVSAVAADQEIAKTAKTFVEKYFDIFKWVLLFESVAFFYLAFIPFAGNPMAFFALVAGTFATGIMANRYSPLFDGTFGKELVFYGMCVIIGLTIMSLAPQGFWGGKGTFFGSWVEEIRSREGAIFVLGLFMTLLTVFLIRGHRKIALIIAGIMIFIFMPPMIRDYWKHDNQGTAQAREAEQKQMERLPQPIAVATPEPPKPQEERVEREVVGQYGAFTEVGLPPMDRLVQLDFTYAVRDRDDCLVAIVYDDAPEGKPFLCREIPSKGIVQKHVTRLGVSSVQMGRDVPVKVRITYIPPSHA